MNESKILPYSSINSGVPSYFGEEITGVSNKNLYKEFGVLN